MGETPGIAPLSEEDEAARDENDPGEVNTSFATKGTGWSGRDKQEDDATS